MKKNHLVACGLILAGQLMAEQRDTLIFEDHFERNESQEKTDEVGGGWSTNSQTRAGGHKQVDLRDGAMYITMHPTADHGVSVTHPCEFRDGSVELRFKLENAKDTLGLDFADLGCKEVHAGHLFKVEVGIGQLDISDLKYGAMNLAIQKLKADNQLTAEQKKSLADKKRSVPVKLETGKWYTLKVAVTGRTVTASIDGKSLNTFSSEGFAHPTKKVLRLAVRRSAVVDDVRAFARPAVAAH